MAPDWYEERKMEMKKKEAIEMNKRTRREPALNDRKKLRMLMSVLLFKCSLTFKTETFLHYWMYRYLAPLAVANSFHSMCFAHTHIRTYKNA